MGIVVQVPKSWNSKDLHWLTPDKSAAVFRGFLARQANPKHRRTTEMIETNQESGTPLLSERLAPVVAFSTFKKALFELQRTGIPAKLEHTEFYLFSPF